MRRHLAILSTAAILLLAACSQSGQSADTTASPASTSTDVVVTTTTEPQLDTVDEPLVDCDNAAFKAALGEKMRMSLCTASWAAGNSDRDTWNCPDTGCRQVRLYRLENGTWRSTATCDTAYPLTYWKSSCYRPDLNSVTVADIPSPAIQCRIWPTNQQLRYVSETGCTPSKSVVFEATHGKCERWNENYRLPLEKCDSGHVIRLVQRRLVALGYDVDVDGYFGPGGVAALMEFQKKSAVLVTGLVDMDTWKALFPANKGLKGTDVNGDGVIGPDEAA